MDSRTGIALKLVATLAFTIMSACVRGLKGEIPIGQVIFFRSFLALIPLSIWFVISRQRIGIPARRNLRSLIAASFAGLGGLFFGFLALAYLPLVNVTVLSYTAPLFTIILAATLLGEQVRIYRWSAVMMGFLGVFITLLPDFVAFQLDHSSTTLETVSLIGTAMALAAAFCAALSAISVRRLNRVEPSSLIVLIYTLTGIMAGVASIAFGWKMPDRQELLLLIGCGLAGGIGQITMTLSLRHAEASLLAPFDYTTMIWALALGYAFMSEAPAAATIGGALVVIAAGLFAMWRESRQTRRMKLNWSPE